MQRWLLLALMGCATEPIRVPPGDGDTLGYGTLTEVTWSGGLCQRRFTCVGTMDIGVSGFVARFTDGELVARGDFTQATRATLDDFVAAIKLSEPTGVFESDGGDSGMVEYVVLRGGETRTYFTNGFREEMGSYVYDVVQSIGTCGTDFATYSECHAQQNP
jgi:hypothetical protein